MGVPPTSKAAILESQCHLCEFCCLDEQHLNCHLRHQHGLQSVALPPAPREHADHPEILEALNQGQIMDNLQASDLKMRLSSQCLLRQFTTTRLAGLFKHLQCAHGHLWLLSTEMCTMFQHCWQGTCVCNPAPVARKGHLCVGWRQIAMAFYNYTPLHRTLIMPCAVEFAKLTDRTHSCLRRWVPGLSPLFSNYDWNGILSHAAACATLSTQCILCHQHEEPDSMLEHHIHEHAFLDSYGPLFTDLWIKQHLTQANFSRPAVSANNSCPNCQLTPHSIFSCSNTTAR